MNFLEKYPGTELRALSWKQPFANLMLHGKIETRVWDTKYRGWVLICASKKSYSINELTDIAGNQVPRIKNEMGIVDFMCEWPEAQAIAIGKLVKSRPMTPYDSNKCFVEYVSPWLSIRKDGQYREKQLWCHVYEDVQPIEPMVRVGSQGWTILGDYYKSQIILL